MMYNGAERVGLESGSKAPWGLKIPAACGF